MSSEDENLLFVREDNENSKYFLCFDGNLGYIYYDFEIEMNII